MEKRKPRGSIVDELALAKSAAWAWYNHGSGSDGKPIREFDVSRTKIDPKPSRYKLEAMNKLSKSPSNSLLDNYEIDRISSQLECYIESSRHAKYHGGDRGGWRAEHVGEMNCKKKSKRGFWLRHGVLCGASRNEVVESRRNFEYSWRRPEKGRVVVAEIVGCRPRKGMRA
ncbi:hypothetical protein BUALT_Bualt04G0037300 [Buddleja alternifolia]|uniref:Uncharacterized protein n=1 Tax=Buddleja alternifolia TaxID=168488 RepID=A0AAV6XWZ3_9LAMI|nr:hypothetical protein BUALT_Bualt04G0037300 [Buddleja alternifolia]